MERFIVAIDGTSGSGKSTTAKLVAEKLGWFYLNTGAMYRAVALKCLRKGISPENHRLIEEIAKNITISFHTIKDTHRVLVDNEDVTMDIKTSEVTKLVSPIANIKEVRKIMVERQRQIADNQKCICEGRDMGTVVFPDAELKIFMDADIDVRAERRYRELKNLGIPVEIDKIKYELALRDEYDSTRENSPLKKAEDAIMLNTTNMSIEDEVNWVVQKIQDTIVSLQNK